MEVYKNVSCHIFNPYKGPPIYRYELREGMGPAPVSDVEILELLSQEPDTVVWAQPREVTIRKVCGRKLGLKVETFQAGAHSLTVVTKVKEECEIVCGNLLTWDRIVKINHASIVHSTKQEVLHLFARIHGDVTFTVLSLSKDPQDHLTGQLPVHCDLPLGLDNSFAHGHCQYTNHVLNESAIIPEKNDNDKSKNRDSSDSGVTLSCDEDQNDCENTAQDEHSIRLTSGGTVDSNQFGISDSSLRRLEMMRRNKGDKHKSHKSGREVTDQAELEPLRPMESWSPPSNFRSEPKFHGLDEGSLSLMVNRDTAVSMADINIDDLVTHSLPAPGPSSQQCGCASCQLSSESRVCYNCGRRPGSSGSRTQPNSQAPMVLETRAEMTPEYTQFLLKSPHLAVWDVNTRVVEIDRGSSKAFGFDYKVKLGKNHDETVEVYTLVKLVDPLGPAQRKLQVGDWIRSVNGTPILDAKQVFKVISESKGSIRLIIQRPVGFSQQPPGFTGTRSTSDTVYRISSPQATGAPSSPAFVPQDPLLPGIIEPEKGQPRKVPIQNIYITNNLNPCDSGTIRTQPFPKTVKFPKVRLFLCGSEAERCANMILKNSVFGCVKMENGYGNVDFSITTDCLGNVVMSKVCSNLFWSNSVHSAGTTSCESYNSGNNNVSDYKCKSCGNDLKYGNVINVEMHVILDDRLFHNCCNYLFTKSSMFILTFDGAKLLESHQTEFTRMQNFAHTIRSFQGDECLVTMYGLLHSTPKYSRNIVDEVQSLFYINNTQLQQYNVMGPELFTSDHTNVPEREGLLSDCRGLQSSMWKAITKSVQQHILNPSLLLVDFLQSARERDVLMTEEQLGAVMRAKLPDYEDGIHQSILQDLNLNGEIIRGKATPYFSSRVHCVEQIVIIDPKVLLRQQRIIINTISEDKIQWSRAHSTSYVSSGELGSISCIRDNENLSSVITEILECVGLIFRQPKSLTDSSQDYFLPYFALVPSSMDYPSAGKKDLELYLQFCDHESSQAFYVLVYGLVGSSDTPDSLTIHSSNCATLYHRDIQVTVFHNKLEDKVKFIFRREDKGSKVKHVILHSWVQQSLQSSLPDHEYILGPPCPLGESCHRLVGVGGHVIDLGDTGAHYCGNVRVDTMRGVRMWRHSQVETLSPTVDSQASTGTHFIPTLPTAPTQALGSLSPLKLRYKILDPLFRHLKVNNGWMVLAGGMGYTADEVNILGTEQEPAKQLIIDWSQSSLEHTADRLVILLEEIDRVDLATELRANLAEETQTRGQSPQGSHGNTASSTNSLGVTNSLGNRMDAGGDRTPSPRLFQVDSPVAQSRGGNNVLPLNIPPTPIRSELDSDVLIYLREGEDSLPRAGVGVVRGVGCSEEGVGIHRHHGGGAGDNNLGGRTITPVETTRHRGPLSQS
ncbi:uncharacterized protein LOC128217458 [Mya arenaria]|uniref:uncharacterized protein LOC128217458 n=1 Tax=Mya arenaria TaxID=6604 RepID=UPI0022E37578|nr:uncharacterized protein LOC128217458 [Mya arenaria]